MILEEFVFLDVEASGLNRESYPIQIGYAWPTMDLRKKAFLIKPAEDWTFWSPASQEIHGFTREQCIEEGLSLDDAIDELEADLEGKRICSDVVEWDGFWLSRLYAAAGRVRTIRLEDVTNPYSLAVMAPGTTTTISTYQQCERWAAAVYPHTHKADEDAQQHAAILRALVDGEFRRQLRDRFHKVNRRAAITEGATT